MSNKEAQSAGSPIEAVPGRALPRRRVLGLVGLAVATVAAGAATSASKWEVPSQTPKVEPLTTPPTREQTTRPGPGPSPAPSPGTQPPTGEGAPAPQPTAKVIVAMKEAAGVEAPTASTQAPTPPRAETQIPRETVNLRGFPLTKDSLHQLVLMSSTGGGEPQLTPTAGIPTGKELPKFRYAEYAAKVWSFLANPESIYKDPAGELKLLATAGAFESTDFPNVHKVFTKSEMQVLSVKLKFSQGIQEVKPNKASPEGVVLKDGADITVCGHYKDRQGRDWSVVSIADYTREVGAEPHLFFAVIPTFQEADSFQWSLERIVKQEGCDLDKDKFVISFEGKDKNFRWEMNTLGEDLFDMAQNEAGVFWVEQTKTGELYPNPIVPYPDSTIIEKLQGKQYDIDLQEDVPVILSGENKFARAEYDSSKNEWVWKEILAVETGEQEVTYWPIPDIEAVEQNALREGKVKLVAVWVEGGGKVIGYRVDTKGRQTRRVISGLQAGYIGHSPVKGKIKSVGSDGGGRSVIEISVDEIRTVQLLTAAVATEQLVEHGDIVDIKSELFKLLSKEDIPPQGLTKQLFGQMFVGVVDYSVPQGVEVSPDDIITDGGRIVLPKR